MKTNTEQRRPLRVGDFVYPCENVSERSLGEGYKANRWRAIVRVVEIRSPTEIVCKVKGLGGVLLGDFVFHSWTRFVVLSALLLCVGATSLHAGRFSAPTPDAPPARVEQRLEQATQKLEYRKRQLERRARKRIRDRAATTIETSCPIPLQMNCTASSTPCPMCLRFHYTNCTHGGARCL